MAGLTEVDMRQIGQIQSSTNNILCPLSEDYMTTGVTLVDSLQDVRTVIRDTIIV